MRKITYRRSTFRIYHRYSGIRRCCLHHVCPNAPCAFQKTKISMVTFACAISVATTCTFALVLPTAPPLAVAEELNIEIGIFFFYALISAFVGMIVGGIFYGSILNKQDHKNNHFYTFEDLDEEEAEMSKSGKGKERAKMGAGKALSILLVPIVLILLGSFIPLAVGKDSAIVPFVTFIGNKTLP